MSNTVWHFANCNTFRAIFGLTSFIWAFYFTFRFFTFYVTYCISRFLTTCMTTRWSKIYFIFHLNITHIQGHKLLDIWGHHISKHIKDDSEVQLIVLKIIIILLINWLKLSSYNNQIIILDCYYYYSIFLK